MLEIRPLSEWKLEEMVHLWNEAFSDYYSDMKMDLERFAVRLDRDALSPEQSLVAWVDGIPAGFVMGGIREVGGRRVAWNGGTAVVPRFRGQGVGRKLMEAVLDMYRRHQVDLATLEAISVNERAISLYKSLGYRVVDHIWIYRSEQAMTLPDRGETERTEYTIRRERPQDVAGLPFYRVTAPWQSQWFCVPGGMALIAENGTGEPAGYALVRKVKDDFGEWREMVAHDLVVHSGRTDGEAVARVLLEEAFAPADAPAKRTVLHVSEKTPWLSEWLEKNGFHPVVRQVQMELELKH
jgi:ribosomal protein S18 acetylase RimI-like enzyme